MTQNKGSKARSDQDIESMLQDALGSQIVPQSLSDKIISQGLVDFKIASKRLMFEQGKEQQKREGQNQTLNQEQEKDKTNNPIKRPPPEMNI